MAKIVMVLRKILNLGLTTGVLVKTRKYLQKFSISDLFYSKNTSLSKKDPKIAISSYFKYFLQIVNAFFKIINSKKQIGGIAPIGPAIRVMVKTKSNGCPKRDTY